MDDQEENMRYRLKSETDSEKLFTNEKLGRRTNLQGTLIYLNQEGIFETFEELFSSIFLDIYIKMGEKEPVVKRSGC